MRKTWVLVADRSRARIFSIAKPNAPLTELEDLVHPEARAHEGDLTTDRPGRSPDHNALGNANSARDEQAQEFAREIAQRLEKGRVHGELERLLVVAAPDVLGMLRKTMNGNLAKIVTLEIDKNVTQQSPSDIRRLLPEYV